jgi:hypothetical protein
VGSAGNFTNSGDVNAAFVAAGQLRRAQVSVRSGMAAKQPSFG